MEPMSLLDPKYMGGLEGGAGYRFQDRYVLSRLPSWLSVPGLEAFQQERLSDVDLFFRSRVRRLIQVRDHRVGLPELREIIDGFSSQEQRAPKQFERYIIASPGMTRPGERLRRSLDRLRAVERYPGPEVAETRKRIVTMLDTLKLGYAADLIVAKLWFDSDIDWLKDEEKVRDLFVGALVQDWDISGRAARDLYLRTVNAVVSERDKVIPLSSFRAAVKRKCVEAEAGALSQFDLISIEFLDRYRAAAGPSYFYDGAVPQWSDIVNDRDIRRDVMEPILHDIRAWCQQGTVLVPVLADSGEGKSTLLLRMAAELATEGRTVLHLRRTALTADAAEVRRIARLADECICIFVDDAARVHNFTQFVQSLCDVPVPIVIAAASRPYEWLPLRSAYRANVTVGLGPGNAEYRLQGLSDRETKCLLQRLAEEGLIRELSDEEFDEAAKYHGQATGRNLLVLVLELTGGKKAREVIRDEVERIRGMGAQVFAAYRYVCLMASVRSFVTVPMLKQLVPAESIELDILARLPGVVERVRDRVLPRHDRIAEIVTELLFEGVDDERGELLCSLITLAFNHGEVDAIKRVAHASRAIPKSQVLRVMGHLFDEAYRTGELGVAQDVIRELSWDGDSQEAFLDLLAAKTRLIWERLVFPATSGPVHLEIYWDRIADDLNLCFTWPDSVDADQEDRISIGAVEEGVSWAQIYALAATQGWKHRWFFAVVAELMYAMLAVIHDESAPEIAFLHAEFLRADLREDRAAILYKSALEQDPNHARAHAGLALALYVTEDYDGALRHYRTARRLDTQAVFWVEFDDLFEEMLERLGELEERIDYQRDSLKRSFRIGRRLDVAIAHIDRYRRVKDLRPRASCDAPDDARTEARQRRVSPDYGGEAEEAAMAFLDRTLELVRTLSPQDKNQFGQGAFGSRFGELRAKSAEGNMRDL